MDQALWCFVWKEKEAKILFDGIVKNYNDAKQLVASQKPTATVLYGSMYQDQWYVARETAGLPIIYG
jgi:ABC-type Fe3+-hydroxamate transport system substrate-binding protein